MPYNLWWKYYKSDSIEPTFQERCNCSNKTHCDIFLLFTIYWPNIFPLQELVTPLLKYLPGLRVLLVNTAHSLSSVILLKCFIRFCYWIGIVINLKIRVFSDVKLSFGKYIPTFRRNVFHEKFLDHVNLKMRTLCSFEKGGTTYPEISITSHETWILRPVASH